MVDFQERDNSRGFGYEADDEDVDEDEDEADDENASKAREVEGAREPDAEPTDGGSGGPESPADSDGGEETAASPEHDEHGDEEGEREHGHDEQEHDHDQGHGHDHQEREGDHGHDHDRDHDHHLHDVDQVGTAIVTVSSSRSLDADPAGDAIEAAMETTGEVVTRELIRDDFDTVQGTVNRLTDRDDVDVIVTAGGTGVTPDDVTIEAVRPLFSKELPGFGELFRILSHDEIGTKVVATRATAGVVEGVPVFCMPGSENAVRLGTEEIIVPEAGHLAGLAARGLEEEDEAEEEEEGG